MSGRAIAMVGAMSGGIRRAFRRAELAYALALAIALGWLSPLTGAPLSFGAATAEHALEIAALPAFGDERTLPPMLPEPLDAASVAPDRTARVYRAMVLPAPGVSSARESKGPRISRPFEVLDQMPAGYAALMFGAGSLLVVVSVALGYVNRFAAPYSATGDEAAWGGRPPLPALVVAPAAEMEASG